jgi:peroxiredoxin
MSLKSRAMMPLMGIAMLITLAGLVMLAVSRGEPAWLGVALAAGALPAFLMLVVGRGKMARTSARLPAVQLFSALGVILAAWPVLSEEGSQPAASYLPFVLAFAGFAIMEWYVWVYSRYGRRKGVAIREGQPLPEVSFERLDGSPISIADMKGSKTLLVFYRGNWCPLCTAQLREVRERAAALAAAGVKVKFVSNQSASHARELAGQLDLPGHMEMLVDRDLEAAAALGIVDKGGTPAGMKGYPADTVMATVIALDEQGRVVFGDETDNYRVRPHPDRFMPLLEG